MFRRRPLVRRPARVIRRRLLRPGCFVWLPPLLAMLILFAVR